MINIYTLTNKSNKYAHDTSPNGQRYTLSHYRHVQCTFTFHHAHFKYYNTNLITVTGFTHRAYI